MNLRLRKLKTLKNEVDCVLILENDPNLFYFTGVCSGVFLYDFSKPEIIANRFNYQEVKKSWIKNQEVMDAKLRDILKLTHGCVGLSAKSLPAPLYEKIKNKIKVKDVSAELEELRMIKDPSEIRCIKKACKITQKIFRTVELKPGITENEIAGIAELKARKMNSKAEINVAFGSNTADPHNKPSKNKLKRNEPAWIDLCVCYKGYYSDVTRTYNHPLIEKLTSIVSNLDIRPGIKASSLEKAVRKKLGKDEKYFTHSLGHGVGIAIHERPFISKNSKDTLKQNMVFTIEPGIYKKDGIRIEDVFLITKKGNSNLSESVI